jgi:hypothetical protein
MGRGLLALLHHGEQVNRRGPISPETSLNMGTGRESLRILFNIKANLNLTFCKFYQDKEKDNKNT